MATSKTNRRRAQRRRAKLNDRSMQTWRKPQDEPSLLCPVMKQLKSTFYAIAYVRQLEFHLKLHNRMPQDEHLSIQDFLNHIPKDFLSDDGSLVVNAALVLPILVNKGILLEKDCPLTERLDQTPLNIQAPRFYAKRFFLNELYPDGKSMISSKRYDKFHASLIRKLERGVVSVGLNVFPSYSKLKHKEIYYPSKKELAGKTECYGHVMVCTGHQYDKMRRLYYELQESAGVKVCDRGFVRIYADMVYEFTDMVV